MTLAIGTRPPAIPPYESLPSASRAKYRDEVDYVLRQADTQTDPKAATRDYFKAADYRRVQTTLDRPFRINTAAMTGLSTALAPVGIGNVLLVMNALHVPGGAVQIYEGVRNQDRRLIVDGVFNAAIGVSSVVAAFSPFGATTFIPLGLVAGREAYMAATGHPIWGRG